MIRRRNQAQGTVLKKRTTGNQGKLELQQVNGDVVFCLIDLINHLIDREGGGNQYDSTGFRLKTGLQRFCGPDFKSK